MGIFSPEARDEALATQMAALELDFEHLKQMIGQAEKETGSKGHIRLASGITFEKQTRRGRLLVDFIEKWRELMP